MAGLIKNAPLLSKIEIRRPVNNGLGILSQNYAPPEWAVSDFSHQQRTTPP
jgi:hypothetical protein